MKLERRRFETCPEYRGHLLSAPPRRYFSTGRRIGLSLHNREVAGSSPAFGSSPRQPQSWLLKAAHRAFGNGGLFV
jgi:hypothetical protein